MSGGGKDGKQSSRVPGPVSAVVSRQTTGDDTSPMTDPSVPRPTGPGEQELNTGMSGRAVNYGFNAGKVNLEPGATMMVHIYTDAEVKNIKDRTTAKIQDRTRGMVETEALAKIMNKLTSVNWLTIKGQAGEGKTTAAFMALDQLQQSGREVFQVETLHEFSKVTKEFSKVSTASPAPVILLDDIFGTLGFDQAEWSKWRQVIEGILDVKEHTLYDSKSKKNEITVIFVSRNFVLNEASSDIGKVDRYFTDDKYVVFMSKSGERKIGEKVVILKAICKSKNYELDDETIHTMCEVNGPHGFPNTCRLFVTLRLQGVNIDTVKFMKAPLEFLNQTVQKFLKDKTKLFLFKEMIKRDGKITVHELHSLDNSHDVIDLADNLLDSYLRKEEGCYSFHHPSIYDSVAFNLVKYDPLFVIKHCSAPFLRERLRLEPRETHHATSNSESNLADQSSETHHATPNSESNLVDQSSETHPATPNSESNLVVQISRQHLRDLAKRFAKEILNRNLVHVLSHPAVTDEQFVKQMMSHIWFPRIRLPRFTDRNTGNSFLSLIASSKSPQILKYLENKIPWKFSDSQINKFLYQMCQNGAPDVLTYLEQSRDTLDINVRDQLNQTPLMIASEFGQMDVMRFLVDKGVSVNMADKDGWSPLHSACVGNNPQAVQWLLDQGADRNSGDRGARTPLHLAAYSGYKDCVVALVNAGASVNVQNTQGRTPLHGAAYWGYKDCVVALVNAGAVVNIQDTDGYTPLHRAARYGYKDCVVALVNAGAGVNIQDTYGWTPLDWAKQNQHKQCVEVLQKAGAVTNRHFN